MNLDEITSFIVKECQLYTLPPTEAASLFTTAVQTAVISKKAPLDLYYLAEFQMYLHHIAERGIEKNSTENVEKAIEYIIRVLYTIYTSVNKKTVRDYYFYKIRQDFPIRQPYIIPYIEGIPPFGE